MSVKPAAFRVFLAAALLCAAPLPARAQTGTALVSASVSPGVVTVGEPFSVRIRVRAPKDATIHFPPVPDTADAIEPVDPRAIEDAAGRSELLDRTAVYRLAAWDVGLHTPHFADVIVTEGGADRHYAVTLSPIVVQSLLPEDSAQQKPKDMRDPVEPPSGLWRYLLLAVVFLAGLGWYWLHRRKHRAMIVPREPEPFVAATGAFDALAALGLPTAGETGRHLIASVDVLRVYVARRFPDLRESLTVPELARLLPASDLPILPERLLRLLERESAVRFARADVSADDALALGAEARAVVQDIQDAYEARLRAAQRGAQRGTRR